MHYIFSLSHLHTLDLICIYLLFYDSFILFCGVQVAHWTISQDRLLESQ